MPRVRAARVSRKLRVAREQYAALGRRTTRSDEPGEVLTRSVFGKTAGAALAITSACTAAAVGFDLCAARTHDETIAVAAKNAAAFLRSLGQATEAAARAKGIEARPRERTCDRLRWEWLASTATVLDGSSDARLAGECARLLSEVDVASGRNLGDGIAARFRVAVAEARSLASAIEQMERAQKGQPAFALA